MGEQPKLDLTDCDKEPIHKLGRVQSFGALFGLSADWTIIVASENAAEVVGLPAADLIGKSARAVFLPDFLDEVGAKLPYAELTGVAQRLFAKALLANGRLYDAAVHLSDGVMIIEVEHSDQPSPIEPTSLVRALLKRLRVLDDDSTFNQAAIEQIRALIGFDRVMLYQFLEDGSGAVIAEASGEGLESFLGLRYPASDIPRQARALYLRNIFRIIADVDDDGVGLVAPAIGGGEALDLSHSVLRSVSPIHKQYLRNMGVAASLSISVVVDGQLWGLVACHHMSPRTVPFVTRSVAELFGEVFALEIAARERSKVLAYEDNERKARDRMLQRLAREGSAFDILAPVMEDLASLIMCDGVAVWASGQYVLYGVGPSLNEAALMVGFLNEQEPGELYSTPSLAADHRPARNYAPRASGVLALPISRPAGEYVLFFRREAVQTVTWAGNPNKPAVPVAGHTRLQPRESFAAWREEVRGTAKPWSQRELRMANTLWVTLREAVLRGTEERSALRRQSEATQKLLIGELNHRIRNILTLIDGIVRHTAGTVSSAEAFAEVIGGRIKALARAHDQLTRDEWSDAPLMTLLEDEMSAYAQVASGRVTLRGSDVLLDPKAFTCLALVIHEMVTNAAKHGAFADRRGTVSVFWSVGTDFLTIEWLERDGPRVNKPDRQGFGMSVVNSAIPFELQGTSTVDFSRDGVRARFQIPMRYVSVRSDSPVPMRSMDVPAQHDRLAFATGKTALVVEDNVIIALDIENILLRFGFEKVILASSVDKALENIENSSIDCAVLDLNLSSDTSIPIAVAMEGEGKPVVFVSGFGVPDHLPERVRGYPMVAKPFSEADLSAAFNLFSANEPRTQLFTQSPDTQTIP
ncbi:MAG: HWE histidine kinase domain-containing protein [Pseudomonadota bacterium]